MKHSSTILATLSLAAAVIFGSHRPVAAQSEMIQQLMEQHMYGQGMSYQGQALVNYQYQYQQMISNLRANPKFVAQAKEKLPKLESLALKLVDEIPAMTTEVESARQAEDVVKTRRNEIARAIATAKLNAGQQQGSSKEVAKLEASHKEVLSEQLALTREVKETATALAKAKAKLKRTAGEIYKLHSILGTAPSMDLAKAKEAVAKKPTSTKGNEPTKSSPSKKKPTSGRLRKWVSANGAFEVYARLIRQEKGSVVLKKTDGQQITVPISALSQIDIEYLQGSTTTVQ